ncbi:hypothetical protein Dsin_023585 [Dipteronia sinensis]|uniref:Subtilisin-like protease SBT5.3 n=1 Tax=Dipteronia sinensis TaxID=43782 RepID=A0AAE0E0T7_9ROSI|nr:hypothetical protein Dsin_023585 [Dipteronia sinensis]
MNKICTMYRHLQLSWKSYIVYLGTHSHGLEPTSADLDRATNSHYNLLSSFVGSTEQARNSIFYSYNRFINGFAAVLEEEEAAEISKHPDVISVFLNKGRQLHTTRSWRFLGLEGDNDVPLDSAWKKARFGENTIIGNLDTGVWPESESFSDEGLGPVPSRWQGVCQSDVKDNVTCNRKLIGARYFNKGYIEYARSVSSNFTVGYNVSTARDLEGHGSHTLSTAGGNFVAKASVFGNGKGTAKGGSPKARVAAYKVCWPPINGNECFDSDIMAGFEAAISDGVDVLSVSLGGSPSQFFIDGIAIGSFHAVKNGIVVVASAGNSGPIPETVSNIAPWIFTVGASTMDREFTSYIGLGNRKHIKVLIILSSNFTQFFGFLIDLNMLLILCKPGTFDPVKVKGKILVCLRGENGRVEKGSLAAKAGAVGMILANNKESGNEILADAHFLPASHINFTDGLSVFAYINSTKTPGAYMTRVKTDLNTEPSPVMASFSSRGPNVIEPSILKPDITAPGVDVIAAYSEAVGPTGEESDNRRLPFYIASGTSMSCPHVSGIVGLLKTLHPDWSPSAIKSAIMTTARIRAGSSGPMLDSNNMKATPFAYGAGHVRPNRAVDPGLVYDMTTDDYLNFLCAKGYDENIIRKLFLGKPYLCPKSFKLADFNYPTITVPNLNGSVTVTRRVKNVGSPGSYNVRVKAPGRVSVTVEPKCLKFTKVGEEKTFKVTLKPMSSLKLGKYIFGDLTCKEKAKESIFYSYNKHINGFAARLEEEHAEQIAKHPDTVSIFENKLLQLHTTRSWEFLGLEKGGDVPLESLWKKANFGEDIIIANIDTGRLIPLKFIGARYFYAGFRKLLSDNNISLPETYFNVRDGNGHGTHTLATAGGNVVANISVMGNGNGTVKGGAPRARVASYKVSWSGSWGSSGGDPADVLQAFDTAIYDGVDVISASIGFTPEDYFKDVIAIGSFHAIKNGVIVVCSSGNSGPDPTTMENEAPWLFTIAASTTDRDFVSYVTLGNGKKLQGASLTNNSMASEKYYPVIDGVIAKLPNAIDIDANPVVQVSGSKTEFNTNPAPMVAQFSSRGPNKIQPAIIKPDVTVPGVDIIAPYRPDSRFPYKALPGTSMSTPLVAGIVALLKKIHPNRSPSAIKSAIMTTASTKYGNSQSPILDQATKLEATAFHYGSGHVRPDLAADPGLVYGLRVEDYLNFLCTHGYNEKTISTFYPGNLFACPKSFNMEDFNYPSIAVPDLVDSVTITRKLLNVGTPGMYNVTVEEIAGVSVQVEPKCLKFGKEDEEQTFKVVFKRNNIVKLGKYVFGGLPWSDGSHCVRSPIAVML